MKPLHAFLPFVLFCGLGLAESASATIFAGSLSGVATYQYPDFSTRTLVSISLPTIFNFYFDTTTPVQLDPNGSADGASYFIYRPMDNSWVVKVTAHPTSGPVQMSEGWRVDINLRNTPDGQLVTLSGASPHSGSGRITLAGPPHAFFSGLDISTLHSGPIDLSRSSASFQRYGTSFDLTHPTAGDFIAPVPEPDIAYFMVVMLLLGAVRCIAFRSRSALA